MEILEYDQVDPVDVLRLNLLSLDYPLTPERVALMRKLDERPFPCFAVYAVDEGVVAGQVGVYRLSVMTTEGPMDIGGACAVCTHPAFGRRGIASRLLDEAHNRMRDAGLRFSSLGTARHRSAYALYQHQGYEDVFITSSTFARLEEVPCESHLTAESAASTRLDLADRFYQKTAAGYLGFARRSRNFLAMMVATGDLSEGEVWLLWHGEDLVGTAMASISKPILTVNNLLLAEGMDACQAVAAIAKGRDVRYARIRVDHGSVAAGLGAGGYPSIQPDWSTFMVKPLRPEDTVEELRRLLGIGTERFLISYIDVT